MSNSISNGRISEHRAQSEALHRDLTTHIRYLDNLVMLGTCGYSSLIRDDFYRLFRFPPQSRGRLLDAGCGTGVETTNFRRVSPDLSVHGVDLSEVALTEAVARPGNAGVTFHHAALEALPFAEGSFDFLSSHEVIEHLEDPAIALGEFHRVLMPGGVCVIATPNGGSLCIEHLRQRLARLRGRRGAPVGSDHVRPPSFWRRQFISAGFEVEAQIFDGAALELQTYVLPAAWMPALSRMLEPLRVLPVINWLICDRVKFRLRKPGRASVVTKGEPVSVCPICRVGLKDEGGGTICGHRFTVNALGMTNFTALADTRGKSPEPLDATVQASPLYRLWRRALTMTYVGFIVALLPLGYVVGRIHAPFGRVDPQKWMV